MLAFLLAHGVAVLLALVLIMQGVSIILHLSGAAKAGDDIDAVVSAIEKLTGQAPTPPAA